MSTGNPSHGSPALGSISAELKGTSIPAVFVLLWSSGFIAAKAGLAHADTLTFLSLRYALVTVLMFAVALIMRAPWPRSWRQIGHIAVAGVMLQAIYFGGAWLSMANGVGAGVSALIVSMQPVLTAVLVGPLLGERVTVRQWLGMMLGAGGVALVVVDKLALGLGTADGMAWSFLALFGITFGTLYQKKFCADMDPRSGITVQFAVATVLIYPLALRFETGRIDWTPDLMISLGYMVIFLSLITVSLLTILIRRNEASRMTSLFFLIPPCATALSYLILDEPVGETALAGMAAAAVGVVLVMAPARRHSTGRVARAQRLGFR